MAAGLPLMKKILIPIAKNVLSPTELSAGMLPAYAAIQKKISWIRSFSFGLSFQTLGVSFTYYNINNFK